MKKIFSVIFIFIFIFVFALSFSSFAADLNINTYSDLNIDNSTVSVLRSLMDDPEHHFICFRTQTETYLIEFTNLDNYSLSSTSSHPYKINFDSFYKAIVYLNTVPTNYGNNTRYLISYYEDSPGSLCVNADHIIATDIQLSPNSSSLFVQDYHNFQYLLIVLALILALLLFLIVRRFH